METETKTPRVLATSQELVGEQIAAKNYVDGMLVLIMRSGNVACFDVNLEGYIDLEPRVPDRTKVKLGLMSKAELDAKEQAEAAAYRDRDKANRRAKYEELKREFEPPASEPRDV